MAVFSNSANSACAAVRAVWTASFAAVSSATFCLSSEQRKSTSATKRNNSMKNSKVLTRDVPLSLLPLGSGSLCEQGQGVLPLFEGGPHVLEGHLLLLEGLALFPEGPGERNHGHLLVEELGLLLLERCAEALQLGALRLSR